MENTLTGDDIRYLKALAHHLKPVVMLGNQGLTPAVLREIAINLDAHELIKVKIQGADRDERDAVLKQICKELDAQAVQHIGKLLILWREGKKPKISLPSAAKKSARR